MPQTWRRRGVYRAMYDHILTMTKGRSDICSIRLYVERTNTVDICSISLIVAQQTYNAADLGMN